MNILNLISLICDLLEKEKMFFLLLQLLFLVVSCGADEQNQDPICWVKGKSLELLHLSPPPFQPAHLPAQTVVFFFFF